MEVHLTPEQERELSQLAVRHGRGANSLAQEASADTWRRNRGSSMPSGAAKRPLIGVNTSPMRRSVSALSDCSGPDGGPLVSASR